MSFYFRAFLAAALLAPIAPSTAFGQFDCGPLVQEPSYTSRGIINDFGLQITVRDQFGNAQPGCPLQLALIPVANSYGHQHTGGVRPVGTLNPQTCNTGPMGEDCITFWTAGDVSGQVLLRSSPSPSGATCSNGFPIGTTNFAMCIQVDGLVTQGSGPGYTLTGVTATHPDNHYGTQAMKGVILALAARYSAATGQTMGVNDMSLIKGGLFDYRPAVDPWRPPHASHRLGVDADIDLPPVEHRRRFLKTLADVSPQLVRIVEPGPLTHYHIRLN